MPLRIEMRYGSEKFTFDNNTIFIMFYSILTTKRRRSILRF